MTATGLLRDVARFGIGGAIVRRIILSAQQSSQKGVGGFTAESLGEQVIVSRFPQAGTLNPMRSLTARSLCPFAIT